MKNRIKIGLAMGFLGALVFLRQHFVEIARLQTMRGLTVTQWLEVLRRPSGTNENALKIVAITDDVESRIMTVEIPVLYDRLSDSNLLGLDKSYFHLYVNDGEFDPMPLRAGNGDCLLEFSSRHLAPGPNEARVELQLINQSPGHMLEATGPVESFFSTNICFVDPYVGSETFKGLCLNADLAAEVADYTIELLGPNGESLKTFGGATSNGVINERWDLIDDRGRTYQCPEVDAVFNVKLTNAIMETVKYRYTIDRK